MQHAYTIDEMLKILQEAKEQYGGKIPCCLFDMESVEEDHLAMPIVAAAVMTFDGSTDKKMFFFNYKQAELIGEMVEENGGTVNETELDA